MNVQPPKGFWPRIRRRLAVGMIWLADGVLDGAVALGRLRSARRLARGQVRTLWGVTPILTLPAKAACDRALGFQSESVVHTTYYITQSFDWNLRFLYGLGNRLRMPGVMERLLLACALLRYDVFHYFNDRGLFTARFGISPRELEALRAAGKRVYVHLYGADIRTRRRTEALGRWNFCTLCPEPGRFCVCDDDAGGATYNKTAQAVTGFVAMADMLAYAPRATNLHYWPIDTGKINAAPPRAPEGPLRVAHAPNHPHFKGSSFLAKAIVELAREGHAIELVQVSGLPNREVLKLFAEVDVVADQFLGGAYGYTALEAMARARPVLSFIRSRAVIMAPEECPVLQTTPETLREVLVWCVLNRNRLPAIGCAGRAYVEKYHSIPAVSARFARLYRESADFPEPINVQLAACIEAERARRATLPEPLRWEHPFWLGALPASPEMIPQDL